MNATLRTALVLAFLASAVRAEPDMSRTFELPAQRLLMRVIATPGATLSPFTTDGCSGGLSVGWSMAASRIADFQAAAGARPPWEACCNTHDLAYHSAGDARTAEDGFDARLKADETLRSCVIATGEQRLPMLVARHGVSAGQVRAAYRAVADAMFHAVRLGGSPCTGLPWRWGYGWPGCFWSPP